MVPSMVWPAIELARLDGRLEHRGEIFFLLAHCVLLGTVELGIISAYDAENRGQNPALVSATCEWDPIADMQV